MGADLTMAGFKMLCSATPFEVRLAAARESLTDQDKQHLLAWRKRSRRSERYALYSAAVEGVADRLQALYVSGWSRVHNCLEQHWPNKPRDRKSFLTAAAWLLENGYTAEHLLRVTVDQIGLSGRVRYPLPRQLHSPSIQDLVPEWVPPEDRRRMNGRLADNFADSVDLDEAAKVTGDYILRHRADPFPLGIGFDFSKLGKSWPHTTYAV